MADVYIAPPAVPVLNTASSQADGLVHWFPQRPDCTPGLDFVSGQQSALSQNALATAPSTFGNSFVYRQNSSTLSDADYYIVDPFTPGWDQNGPSTISFWVRMSSAVQYGQHCFYPIDSVAGNNRFYIGIDPIVTGASEPKNRSPYLRVVGNGGVIYQLQNSDYKVSIDEWTLLCAIVSPNADDYRLYINATEIPYSAALGENNRPGTFNSPFTKLGIGGQGIPVQAAIQGNAIDFRIYDKALTAAEVAAMCATATRWELWEGEPKFADETLEVFFFRRRRRLC